ncbi:MAG: selenocysteine-specific translation elongation factor, partial [Actinomycetota bacterium]
MYVLGTAGHVDHGKSTLIERLTGIDPDRLVEEKERGLTIDLGFAWLTLPSGREIGIVDVPGHERFVHNMLAGVGSIDATIFVVAANEGWKPQSEEHLAILDLLGARGGVVALTKSDLVDGAELAQVGAEIGKRLDGTALAGAPIVPVSATNGEGVGDLLAALDALLDRTPPSEDRGRPRLFVDRSFSMKGAGTVVTGTLKGGSLRVEDEIEILPSAHRARVRSIQSHKTKRDEIEPGSRVALNLAGLDRAAVVRGDAVVRPGQWRATDVLDVVVKPVRDLERPLTGRGAFKLHIGAAEVDVRIRFLDPDRLAPGGEAFARLSPSEPVVAAEFDRFVLRDAGRGTTVAGGTVLDAHPTVSRLGDAALKKRIEDLQARRAADREGLAALVVAERGVVPITDLAWLTGSTQSIGPVRGYAVAHAWREDKTKSLEAALARFHAENPLARGMPRADVGDA